MTDATEVEKYERIWLEARPTGTGDRQWCQDKVWDDGIEYVRADLATRSPPQPTQSFRAGAYERHMARTPRIVSDEMVERMARVALDAGEEYLTSPDTYAIARAILAAMEPSK